MSRFLLWLLKIYTWFNLKMYFSKFQVDGKKNIPVSGPIIFAVNHQNAFLDAVLIACTSTRFPHFLARADVFNSPVARFFLKWLKIMPIYRFRDGLGAVRRSLGIIETCIALLENNKAVLIFPEGNHDLRFFLRPLQKGISRIAIGSAALKGKGLKIVPVGVQYENHTSYGSRVLISYGKPIEVEDFFPEYEKPNKDETDKLLQTVHHELKSLLVHIPLDNYDEEYSNWWNNRIIYRDLVKQLNADQRVIGNNERREKSGQVNPGKWLYLIFSFLLGIVFLPPFLIVEIILKTTVEDPAFIGPMKFSWGMIFYPAYLAVMAIIVLQLTGSWYWVMIVILGALLLLKISHFLKPYSLKVN